ncbi:hypothetical protein TNCT_253651 [Trichonephila clavata]|uniref:Uncharacterized protein n=1 Tax=Trichonephila clavata TaxID=2740835 RepID=A0A8X6H9C7_TRICU|nr:hypothetical protein TNCT_253651 [Trichonephila clavata]
MHITTQNFIIAHDTRNLNLSVHLNDNNEQLNYIFVREASKIRNYGKNSMGEGATATPSSIKYCIDRF